MKAVYSMAPAVAMPSGNPLATPTVAALTPGVGAATGLVRLDRVHRSTSRNGAAPLGHRMRVAWEASGS